MHFHKTVNTDIFHNFIRFHWVCEIYIPNFFSAYILYQNRPNRPILPIYNSQLTIPLFSGQGFIYKIHKVQRFLVCMKIDQSICISREIESDDFGDLDELRFRRVIITDEVYYVRSKIQWWFISEIESQFGCSNLQTISFE